MKNITRYFLAMMIILISSTVMLAQLQVSSTNGKPPVLTGSRAVLYEQSNPAGGGQASQDFESAYDAYDCQGADDFYIPTGFSWTIQTVTVSGSGSLTATLANVYIYADVAGMPAVTAATTLMGLACTNASGVLAINIPGGLQLGPGHFWISVQDASPYNPDGQWFWQRTSSTYNNNACWRNPGNGFGTGATAWTTMIALGYPDSDFMFRLEGYSNPLPACDYRIDLYDTFGDGWNGSTIDVLVNGNIILDNITLTSGAGPVSYYFSVTDGEMITTTFNPGSWYCEPYYLVYNSEGNQVYYVPNNCNPVIPSGQLYATCPSTAVPITNWALFIGIGLIMIAAVSRFRRLT